MFRPLALLIADAVRGGFRRPDDSPRARGKVLFSPIGDRGGDTPSTRRAFWKRVRRRRARKGYR